ncbi:MAG TPA: hypothetical protein ENI27_09225 [bacterium]|nr:hypothetical protein [bacterium]
MTVIEQEKLFKRVQKRFFVYHTLTWISGYIHGVIDGLEKDEPRSEYIKVHGPYATGYKYGFADAYGSDALCKWSVPTMPQGPDYRWWERATK